MTTPTTLPLPVQDEVRVPIPTDGLGPEEREAQAQKLLRALRRAIKATVDDVTAQFTYPLTLDDLAPFMTYWNQHADAEILPAIQRVYDYAVETTVTNLASVLTVITNPEDVIVAADTPLDINPNAADVIPTVHPRVAVQYMAQASNRLVGVGNEYWEYMRGDLTQALAQGWGVDKTVHYLSEGSLLGYGGRAEVIARTEGNGALNAGALDEMLSTELPMQKTWLATLGLRTRESHAKAHQQTVGIKEKFYVGGYMMDRPHDSQGGSAAEVVNCRCSVIFDIPKWATVVQQVCEQPTPTVQETKKDLSPKSARPGEPGRFKPPAGKSNPEGPLAARHLREGLRQPRHGLPEDDYENSTAAKRQIQQDLAARMRRKGITQAQARECLNNYVSEGSGKDVYETLTRALVHQWAIDSSDLDGDALAMQLAVRAEFGLHRTDPIKQVLKWGDTYAADDAKRIYTANEKVLRAFVRAMYESTQENFQRHGITYVRLYRGTSPRHVPGAKHRGSVVSPIEMNPASSYSSSREVAESFGEGPLFEVDVPVDRILGTARTGYGCLSEREFVVLDTEGQVLIVRM